MNRYGITLAADLYTPKIIKGKLTGLEVGSPYEAVKEQAGGIYAMKMVERGYVILAFDQSFNGESGGNVRLVSSPDINTEDFCVSVDCLVCLENVDPEKIGIIGICGFCGLAISAAIWIFVLKLLLVLLWDLLMIIIMRVDMKNVRNCL